MSTIMYKDIVYGGGGGGSSDVVPNPAGTPLFDLNTVEINNIVYNIPGSGGGGTGDYDDLTDKPQINGVTLSGNKTAENLGIIITKTQAEYDALPLEEKTDPNKVYYISDASGSGGSGATVMSELDDVQISSLSDGQILKYDNSIHKWKNANEYSYTLPTASANTLGGIKIGDRLSIDANGVLSANVQTYTLPTASISTLGGIKVGSNLSIDSNGKLTSNINNIGDLTDVTISSPTNDQVLKYNSTSQKWENQKAPVPVFSDWGWNVLYHKFSFTIAPDEYRLISFEFPKYSPPTSYNYDITGKMVIIQGIHVKGSVDGSSYLYTLDFDFENAINMTDPQTGDEIVRVNGMLHSHSSVTLNYIQAGASVIYI